MLVVLGLACVCNMRGASVNSTTDVRRQTIVWCLTKTCRSDNVYGDWRWTIVAIVGDSHWSNTLECRAPSSIRALLLSSFTPVATFLSSCEVSNLYADYCLMPTKTRGLSSYTLCVGVVLYACTILCRYISMSWANEKGAAFWMSRPYSWWCLNAVGSLSFLKAFVSSEHCRYSTVMMVRINCSQQHVTGG